MRATIEESPLDRCDVRCSRSPIRWKTASGSSSTISCGGAAGIEREQDRDQAAHDMSVAVAAEDDALLAVSDRSSTPTTPGWRSRAPWSLRYARRASAPAASSRARLRSGSGLPNHPGSRSPLQGRRWLFLAAFMAPPITQVVRRLSHAIGASGILYRATNAIVPWTTPSQGRFR